MLGAWVPGVARRLYLTVALGLAFVGGQLEAWKELASHGVYLSSNPSSSFFYLLTAAHGIHLLGGSSSLLSWHSGPKARCHPRRSAWQSKLLPSTGTLWMASGSIF